eukprot:6208681-Pleurochrysis_carterae.AAC.4
MLSSHDRRHAVGSSCTSDMTASLQELLSPPRARRAHGCSSSSHTTATPCTAQQLSLAHGESIKLQQHHFQSNFTPSSKPNTR